MAETVYALVVQDIFHFVGLALIATGLFKRLKLNVIHIAIIGKIRQKFPGTVSQYPARTASIAVRAGIMIGV